MAAEIELIETGGRLAGELSELTEAGAGIARGVEGSSIVMSAAKLGEGIGETSFISGTTSDIGRGAGMLATDVGGAVTSSEELLQGAGSSSLLTRGTAGIRGGQELAEAEQAGFHLPPAFSTRSQRALWEDVGTMDRLSSGSVSGSSLSSEGSDVAVFDATQVKQYYPASRGTIPTVTRAADTSGDAAAFRQMLATRPVGTASRFVEDIPLGPITGTGTSTERGAAAAERIAMLDNISLDSLEPFEMSNETDELIEAEREEFFIGLQQVSKDVSTLVKRTAAGLGFLVAGGTVAGIAYAVWKAVHGNKLPPSPAQASTGGGSTSNTEGPSTTTVHEHTTNTKTQSHFTRPSHSGGKANISDLNLQKRQTSQMAATHGVKTNSGQNLVFTNAMVKFFHSLPKKFLQVMSHIDTYQFVANGIIQWRQGYVPDGTLKLSDVFLLPTNTSLGSLEKEMWLVRTFGKAATLVEAIITARRQKTKDDNEAEKKQMVSGPTQAHIRVRRDTDHAKVTGTVTIPAADETKYTYEGSFGFYKDKMLPAAAPPVRYSPNYIFHHRGYETTAQLQTNRLNAAGIVHVQQALSQHGQTVGDRQPPASSETEAADLAYHWRQWLHDYSPINGGNEITGLKNPEGYKWGCKPWLGDASDADIDLPYLYDQDWFGRFAYLSENHKIMERLTMFEPIRQHFAYNPIAGYHFVQETQADGTHKQSYYPLLWFCMNSSGEAEMSVQMGLDLNNQTDNSFATAMQLNASKFGTMPALQCKTKDSSGNVADLGCWWLDYGTKAYLMDCTKEGLPPNEIAKGQHDVPVTFINVAADGRRSRSKGKATVHMKDVDFLEGYMRFLKPQALGNYASVRAVTGNAHQFHLPVESTSAVTRRRSPARFLANWIQTLLFRFCQAPAHIHDKILNRTLTDVEVYKMFNKLCHRMAENFRYRDLVSWYAMVPDFEDSTMTTPELAYWLQEPLLQLMLDRAVGDMVTIANQKWIGIVQAIQTVHVEDNYDAFDVALNLQMKVDVKSNPVMLPIPIPILPVKNHFSKIPLNFEKTLRFLLQATSQLMLIEPAAKLKTTMHNNHRFEASDFGFEYLHNNPGYDTIPDHANNIHKWQWDTSRMVIVPMIFKPNWAKKSYNHFRGLKEFNQASPFSVPIEWNYPVIQDYRDNPFFFDLDTEDAGTYEDLVDFFELMKIGNVRTGFQATRETYPVGAAGKHIYVQFCPWSCGQNVRGVKAPWFNDSYWKDKTTGDLFKSGCSCPMYAEEPTDKASNACLHCGFLITTEFNRTSGGETFVTIRKPTILECLAFLWTPEVAMDVIQFFCGRFSASELMDLTSGEKAASTIFYNTVVKNLKHFIDYGKDLHSEAYSKTYWRPDAPMGWGKPLGDDAWGPMFTDALTTARQPALHTFQTPILKFRIVVDDKYDDFYGPQFPWGKPPIDYSVLHFKWFQGYTIAAHSPIQPEWIPYNHRIVFTKEASASNEMSDASLKISDVNSSLFLDAAVAGFGPVLTGTTALLDLGTDSNFFELSTIYHDKIATDDAQFHARNYVDGYIPGIVQLFDKTRNTGVFAQFLAQLQKNFGAKSYDSNLQKYFNYSVLGAGALNWPELTAEMAWEHVFLPGMRNLEIELNKLG